MRKKNNNSKTIERFDVNINDGLSSEQIKTRIAEGKTNVTRIAVGKSYWEIITTNVFSFFNVLLFIIAGLMIFAGYYSGLFFLVVILPNMAIGLFQDLKARYLMGKLQILTQNKVTVIRNKISEEIPTNQIVLDDIFTLSSGQQIPVDGVVLSGTLLVNESLLTGESDAIVKNVGDIIFSGSFVVSGNAKAKADKVGYDTYVENLQNSANKFKRSPSEILKSLRKLFFILGFIVIVIGLATICIKIGQDKFSSLSSFKKEIGPISGSLVGMIPSGLYLLTSTALTVGVISLAKKNAKVQDFYSVEMLARTNILCVDKTGTITDGQMNVHCLVLLGNNKNDEENIKQLLSNFVQSVNDNNVTAIALKKYFNFDKTSNIKEILPFNSANKYSAATFTNGETYILGAAEFLNINNKDGINRRIDEFTSQGFRVLVFGQSSNGISEQKVDGFIESIALIVLQDHIRENAQETFKWFKDNNVKIKVISGDNARTVSEVAKNAGVENAEQFISLDGLSDEQVKEAALKYNVFGRVKPEQKEMIVKALKENKDTVAMTGDGVNDILALKRADCSIAMASGSDAAKNVSHIVLLNSDFSTLPAVVAEGRRVINNIQRTASLFLVKTSFAIFFSILFLCLSIFDQDINYPFVTNNMYCWEIATIGLAAFFVALEPNAEIIKGKFIQNIIKKVIPSAITVILGTLIILGLPIIYPDLFSNSQVISMAVLTFSIISLAVLYNVCYPLSKYRTIVFAGAVLTVVLMLLASYFVYQQTGNDFILQINHYDLFAYHYLISFIVAVVCLSIYLLISYIVGVIKGEVSLDANNKSRNKKSTK